VVLTLLFLLNYQLFDDLEYFHVSDANPDQDQYNMGIERIGTLSGRYQVYRDLMHQLILVSLDTKENHYGLHLRTIRAVTYSNSTLTLNFAPVKGIMTRYAKKKW
jgi:hypothetical protein